MSGSKVPTFMQRLGRGVQRVVRGSGSVSETSSSRARASSSRGRASSSSVRAPHQPPGHHGRDVVISNHQSRGLNVSDPRDSRRDSRRSVKDTSRRGLASGLVAEPEGDSSGKRSRGREADDRTTRTERPSPPYPVSRPCEEGAAEVHAKEFVKERIAPSLYPYTDGKPDVPTTTIKWVEEGLLNDRVRFKGWKGFEEEVRTMKDDIEGLKASRTRSLERCERRLGEACEKILRGKSESETDVVYYARCLLTAVEEAVIQVSSGKFAAFPGFKAGKRIRTEHVLEGECDVPLAIEPDLVFFANHGEATSLLPVAVIEVKKPPSYLMNEEQFARDRGEVAPEGFIEFLKQCYAGEEKVTDRVAMRYGQVISEAVHSRSGYGMLWTFDRAVFIKTRPKSDNGLVEVEVSRMYFCDDLKRLPLFYALVAFTVKALEAASRSETENSVKKCAKILSKSKSRGKASASAAGNSGGSGGRDRNNRDGSGSRTKSGSEKRSDAKADGSSSKKDKDKSSGKGRSNGNGASGSGKKACGNHESGRGSDFVRESDPWTIENEGRDYEERWREWWSAPFCGADGEEERDVFGFKAVDRIAERIALFESTWEGSESERDVCESEMLFDEERTDGKNGGEEGRHMRECMRRWEDDEVVERAYEGITGFVAMGGCGVVMIGETEGKAMAIKYWNDVSLAGKSMLRDEILMYCWLGCRHGWTMGSVIPQLVGVGMMEWKGAVLVTEFVGESVGRDGEGGLVVGGESVGEKDFEEIRVGALESLEALHGCGVVHGDVSMRNLRAVRADEDGSDRSDGKGTDGVGRRWKMMWIDLGCARLGASEREYEDEKSLCWRMFERGYVEDIW